MYIVLSILHIQSIPYNLLDDYVSNKRPMGFNDHLSNMQLSANSTIKQAVHIFEK